MGNTEKQNQEEDYELKYYEDYVWKTGKDIRTTDSYACTHTHTPKESLSLATVWNLVYVKLPFINSKYLK